MKTCNGYLCLCIVSLMVLLALPHQTTAANITLIIDEDSQGNRPPNPEDSDPALVNRLTAVLGHTVKIHGDEEPDPVDLTGQDLLIISSTISSGNVGGAYRDIDIPILYTERAISNEMNISGDGGDMVAGIFDVEIVNNQHFITQGLPLDLVLFQNLDGTDELVYIAPSGSDTNAPGMRILGVALENPEFIFLAAIDRGELLNNGLPSVNRRVFYGIPNFGFDFMTDEAWQVFDRAIEWLLSTPKASFEISRSINPTVLMETGGSVEVVLTLVNTSGSAASATISEQPPSGWAVSGLTASSGTATQANGAITWQLTDATGTQTLRYQAAAAAGDHAGVFAGTVTEQGNEFPIGGDMMVRVSLGGKPLVFLETNGQVVIEAENFRSNLVDVIDPTYRWVLGGSGEVVSEPGIDFGMSGTDYSGDFVHGNQRPRTDRGVPNDDFLAQLTYRIEFTTGGTYYLWVHEFDASPDQSNTSYTNIDSLTRPDALRLGSGFAFWEWDNGKGDAVVSYDIAPGLRTLYIWLGETGIALDKIILTTDAGFVPEGLGPQESETRSDTAVEEWSLY